MSETHDVQGYCPMGCGKTLFLAVGGYVTCSWVECPNRTAVSDLLADSETEHVVEFTLSGFSILHPLKERLETETSGDQLWDCRLHLYVESLSGPPTKPGRYRARPLGDDRWHWESVPS